MQKIKVNKPELLKILESNRKAHNGIFREAQEGFRNVVVAELERRLELARSIFTCVCQSRKTTRGIDDSMGRGSMVQYHMGLRSGAPGRAWEWRSWRRTICDGPVLGSAMLREVELEQIQFLLGHVAVQTTERYLGCKQRIRTAVNDRIGIEPNP
jgi:hypothetical protein